MTETPRIDIEHPRPCAGCTLCCKFYPLADFNKPAGKWCEHCQPGTGCKIYEARPTRCQTFQCVWSVTEALGEDWRPDRAGFVIAAHEMQLFIEVEPSKPDAWRRAPYYKLIKAWSARNRPNYLLVIVRVGDRSTTMIFPEADIELGPTPQDSRIESGYTLVNGRPTPWARVVATSQEPAP